MRRSLRSSIFAQQRRAKRSSSRGSPAYVNSFILARCFFSNAYGDPWTQPQSCRAEEPHKRVDACLFVGLHAQFSTMHSFKEGAILLCQLARPNVGRYLCAVITGQLLLQSLTIISFQIGVCDRDSILFLHSLFLFLDKRARRCSPLPRYLRQTFLLR
jgi:hypothetical protein